MEHSYPITLMAQVAWAVLAHRQRPFARDAARLLATLHPPPEVQGLDNVPHAGGLVLTFNHYYSATFPSWWSAIVLSGLILPRWRFGQAGMHWIMTEAWTYPDPLRSRLLSPLSRVVFRRLAHVYGFVAMPPMPPRAHEVEARARAVRQVLALARQPDAPLISVSPEGHDSPGARLLQPPPGVGRFLLLLASAGLPFLPAGINEEDGQLQVRFGALLRLEPPPGLPRAERDRWGADQVMLAVGRLLPPRLWGAYEERLQLPLAATAPEAAPHARLPPSDSPGSRGVGVAPPP